MRHPVLEKILNILNSVEKSGFYKIEYKLLDIKKLNKGIDEIKTIKVNDKKLILFSIKNNMEDFLEKNENFADEIFNFIDYIEKNKDEIESIIEELDFFDENEIDRLLFVFSKEKIDKELLDLFLIGCSYPLEINKAKSSNFSFCLDFCKTNIKKETELLQYRKVINILNEYYNTNDLLWKFLLLYHILENFADRLILRENIVDKNIENIDKLSFIFKAFNDNNKEESLLQNLISKFNKEINEISVEKICLLQELYQFIEVDNRALIYKKPNRILPNKLVKVIYKLRNSIVHNKEKEWIHIDNSLLLENEEIRESIEKVLLPFMEKIIKKIVYEKNILDYPMDKNYILLWGDEPITEEDNNETT